MEIWQIILLALAAYLLLTLLYSTFIYFMIQKKMGRRTDKNPLLSYYTADDYDGLNATSFAFKNDRGVILNGKHYDRSGTRKDEVIVFFHGYGAGHEAYTTLINDLITVTKRSVITFDYTGCDLSEGDKIPNTLQALADGHLFLRYIQSKEEFRNKKLILIGHSWGGFVATNLLPYNKDKNILKVVSINGITDFSLLYKNSARAPYIFIPLNNFLNAFRYKEFAFSTTRKSIKNTTVPHLILHGLKDDSVPFSPYISSLILQSDAHKMIKFHFGDARYHNVYLTKESELKLRQLQSNLKYVQNKKDGATYVQAIKDTAFAELVENDPKFLKLINDFINGGTE